MVKVQWHPAFCAAMRLELRGNPALQFINEFNLSEKPLETDLLVIKKISGIYIDNPIGEFFEGYNILEYKGPSDHQFNEYAIYQALAYAFYYCSRYRTKDVTVSLVVSRSHFNILKWLDAQKIDYCKRYDGIYTIMGISLMKMQVVVTEELQSEAFIWLSALTDKLTEQNVKRLVNKAYSLEGIEEKQQADAIMQVLLSANGKVFEKIKEDKAMSALMMELMKPEVEKYANEYASGCIKDYTTKIAKEMLLHGDDNEYIRHITHLTDNEIDALRKEL